MQDMEYIKTLVGMIRGSKFLPKYLRGQPDEDIYFTILRGQELGLTALQSLASLYEKNESLTLGAAGMRALVLGKGHKIGLIYRGDDKCILKGERIRSDGSVWTEEITYSLDDARTEGVLDAPFWRKHPANMCLARATGILVRFMFADIVQGLYATEESEDATGVLRESGNFFDGVATPPPVSGTMRPSVPEEILSDYSGYLITSENFPGQNKNEPLGDWSTGALRYMLATPSIKSTLNEVDIAAAEAVLKVRLAAAQESNDQIENLNLGE